MDHLGRERPSAIRYFRESIVRIRLGNRPVAHSMRNWVDGGKGRRAVTPPLTTGRAIGCYPGRLIE